MTDDICVIVDVEKISEGVFEAKCAERKVTCLGSSERAAVDRVLAKIDELDGRERRGVTYGDHVNYVKACN